MAPGQPQADIANFWSPTDSAREVLAMFVPKELLSPEWVERIPSYAILSL
jgi:hypothetical protein